MLRRRFAAIRCGCGWVEYGFTLEANNVKHTTQNAARERVAVLQAPSHFPQPEPAFPAATAAIARSFLKLNSHSSKQTSSAANQEDKLP